MEEEEALRVSASGQPDFFHDDSLELLLTYFEPYRRNSRISYGVDRIAELFLVRVFDLIRSLAYIRLKTSGEGRQRFVDAFGGSLSGGGPRSAQLLEKVLGVNNLDEQLQEIHLLLGQLRECYFSFVRSPLTECWERSLLSLWRGDSRCASYQRCLRDGVSTKAAERCEEFYSSWRNTSLSIQQREHLRTNSAALTKEIYDRCQLLEFFTVRPRLEEYLARPCKQSARPHGDKRSVHGLVVRLLTEFSDHCLEELSYLLQPAIGEKLYFVNPAADSSH